MVKKALHIFLAMHLLISSIGLPVYEHICQKNGSTFSLFIESNNCCSKSNIKSPKRSCGFRKTDDSSAKITKKPCCEDKITYNKLEVISKDLMVDVSPVKELLTSTLNEYFTINYLPQIPIEQKSLGFHLYKPPPIHRVQFTILYQSFLC